MKQISIAILVLFILIKPAYSSNLKIINSISVEKDVEYQGAKGISITYRYNFLPIEEENHNDTILKGAVFHLKTYVLENSSFVEPANGYASVKNTNDDIEFDLTLMGSEITPSKFDKKITQFIPYASLNLVSGNHNIQIKAVLEGKDATGFFHQQEMEKPYIQFTKPATKLFTLNIDYIELNTLNSKGHAWDYALFRTDAPDVGVTILVGNTEVWKSHVNDTYMFAVGPNSKNINFTISENDNVIILVQDIDVMFHDFVARLVFETKNKKINQIYTYNKTSGNIKSCNLNFKIE